MQAIIPVAGAGTRLRPLTYTQPKVLISVAGKPILSYIFENLKSLGVNKFVLVVGYLGDKIIDYVEKHYPELDTEFVIQQDRDGLGHAILCAKNSIDQNLPVIIQLGDTILTTDFNKLLSNTTSTLCIKKVEDPRSFGVVELDQNCFITKIEEKPLIPMSNLALVGFYYIKESKELMNSLEESYQINSPNSELHLATALQKMLSKGIRFQSQMAEQWYDLGKRDILLETNASLLKNQKVISYGNRVFENSIIVPPVSIAPNTEIKNSIIGPFVTIGENSTVEHAILKNSIVGSFTRIENILLNDSLIGSDAKIIGHSQSLNIGDNTEIDLSGTL